VATATQQQHKYHLGIRQLSTLVISLYKQGCGYNNTAITLTRQKLSTSAKSTGRWVKEHSRNTTAILTQQQLSTTSISTRRAVVAAAQHHPHTKKYQYQLHIFIKRSTAAIISHSDKHSY
jgi:hypothetical protein